MMRLPKKRNQLDGPMTTPAIRTIIADDEPLARRKLRILLASEPGLQIIAECKSGQETIEALRSLKPDLLFLDIQMPEADGFQVLEAVPAENRPVVIFTTAFDQYAIRAFEEHALDYLLKPFDQERLHSAVERARVELLKNGHSDLTNRILEWLARSKPAANTDRRLVIKTGGRVVFLDMEEIDWVEASANYVRLHAGAQSYLLREGIGRVSERLDPNEFVRIHRSIIVNAQRIKELQPCNSGEYIVVLKDGKELPGSRGYRAGLQQLIERNN
jgi:two-component system, LytTR family, response regulator